MDGEYPASVHKLVMHWYPPLSILSCFEQYQQLQSQQEQGQVQQQQGSWVWGNCRLNI